MSTSPLRQQIEMRIARVRQDLDWLGLQLKHLQNEQAEREEQDDVRTQAKYDEEYYNS